MSNGKIFYNNLAANTTISLVPPDAEMEGFEKEYLDNNNQGVVWRSNDITTTEIRMAFGLATPVKGIVVMNHNLVSGDTFSFECSNDVNFGSGVLTKTIGPDKGFEEVDWNHQYYRLVLSKQSGTYIQVGEIYLVGSSYDFDRNYQWNYSYTREINRNSKETTSGQIYRKTRFIRKGFSLDFDGMNDSQKETFETISENDYICFLPTGSPGDLYYGIIDFSSYTHVYSNYWSANITFMENPK